MLKYFKPYTTLGLGILLGVVVYPRAKGLISR